jgi:hypothetical protein
LTGDYEGVIEDFEFYVAWLKETDQYKEGAYGRETWIKTLQAGENPFDEETLKKLRNQWN